MKSILLHLLFFEYRLKLFQIQNQDLLIMNYTNYTTHRHILKFKYVYTIFINVAKHTCLYREHVTSNQTYLREFEPGKSLEFRESWTGICPLARYIPAIHIYPIRCYLFDLCIIYALIGFLPLRFRWIPVEYGNTDSFCFSRQPMLYINSSMDT